MNKGNKLLLGVLSFVVVCVVGYALFSETITVTGTASATGSFDITASCSTGVDSKLLNLGYSSEDFVEGGYKNDYCTATSDGVSFGADLDYPSAQRYFTITLKNTGTIPAKYNLNTGSTDNAVICKDDSECTNLKEDLPEEQFEFFKKYYYGYSFVGLKNSNGDYITDETEMSNKYNEETNDVIIDSNESIVVVASIFWHKDNPPYTQGTLYGNFTTTATLNFDFTQVTE